MSSKEPEMIRKARIFKDYLEVILSCFSGTLFIISSSIDVIQLNCFWSDYALIIYSCILLLLMIWNILFPPSFPIYLKENLGIICSCNGKGILMIIISLLFINDNFYLHKFTSIILLISGIILIIFEILIPNIEEKNNHINNTHKEVKIEENQIIVEEKIKNVNNPYYIPEDF